MCLVNRVIKLEGGFFMKGSKLAVKFSYTALLLTFLSVTTLCAINPTIRYHVKDKIYTNRRILSSATGYILHDDTRVKALKIIENNNLILEVYSNISYSETPNLISKLDLGLTKDAYFTFKGVSTNLAFDDVDQDGKLEVIVPGYDRHLTAKIEVYKYSPINNEFFKSKDMIYN